MNQRIEVKSVRVERIPDYDPDLSYIGTYDNKDCDGAIDRQKRGAWERGEYRYFHSCNNERYDPRNWAHVSDREVWQALHSVPERQRERVAAAGLFARYDRDAACRLLTRCYAEQDYDRMEAYNRGEWCCYGVRATAEVFVNGVRQNLRSAGLWGLDSDSEESYFAEVEEEQMEELRDILAALGATVPEAAQAVDA